jgi:hypothetical protein
LLQEQFNLSLPEWTRGIYPDKLVPLTVFSFKLNAYDTKLQKLKAGKLPARNTNRMVTKNKQSKATF